MPLKFRTAYKNPKNKINILKDSKNNKFGKYLQFKS